MCEPFISIYMEIWCFSPLSSSQFRKKLLKARPRSILRRVINFSPEMFGSKFSSIQQRQLHNHDGVDTFNSSCVGFQLFLFTTCYQMFLQYRLSMIGRASTIFIEQHNVTQSEYFMNLHFNLKYSFWLFSVWCVWTVYRAREKSATFDIQIFNAV